MKRIITLAVIIIFQLSVQGKSSKTDNLESMLIKKGLVDVQSIEPDIRVDLKYSSTDNFLKKDIYGSLEKCYLQREIAFKLKNAQRILQKKHPHLSLIIYDGVRPRRFQYKMWEMVKGTGKQKYVADPAKGSIHNYGAAVDLSIINIIENKELDMGTPFDYFGPLAQPRYEQKYLRLGKLTEKQIENRKLLRSVMNSAGFTGILSEWWHFNGLPRKAVKDKYEIID